MGVTFFCLGLESIRTKAIVLSWFLFQFDVFFRWVLKGSVDRHTTLLTLHTSPACANTREPTAAFLSGELSNYFQVLLVS